MDKKEKILFKIKSLREDLERTASAQKYREETGHHFEHLQEMSYPCKKSDGYGMILEIRSTDEHGEIGNKDTPAHAHVYDTNKKEVGEIIITVNRPKTPKEVIAYRSVLPDGYTKKICKWANDKNKEMDVFNWTYLKSEWKRRKPD